MSAYTPGPWSIKIDPARQYKDWSDNGGYRIDADGVEQLCYVWNTSTRLPLDATQDEGPAFGSENGEANAHLISAAPDLLEALQECVMHMVNATLEHCDGNKCREQWCIGCFGEESANAYVETANKAYSKAIAVINKATGGTP